MDPINPRNWFMMGFEMGEKEKEEALIFPKTKINVQMSHKVQMSQIKSWNVSQKSLKGPFFFRRINNGYTVNSPEKNRALSISDTYFLMDSFNEERKKERKK